MEFETMIKKADNLIESLKWENNSEISLDQLNESWESYNKAINDLPFDALWVAGLKEEAEAKYTQLNDALYAAFPQMQMR
jgi:hypothetical protein